eukprot:COSAG05_NODE_1193_length_5569_cov_3.034552_3_plen_168_part_00
MGIRHTTYSWAELDRACDAIVSWRKAQIRATDQIVLTDSFRALDRKVFLPSYGGVDRCLDSLSVVCAAASARSDEDGRTSQAGKACMLCWAPVVTDHHCHCWLLDSAAQQQARLTCDAVTRCTEITDVNTMADIECSFGTSTGREDQQDSQHDRRRRRAAARRRRRA